MKVMTQALRHRLQFLGAEAERAIRRAHREHTVGYMVARPNSSAPVVGMALQAAASSKIDVDAIYQRLNAVCAREACSRENVK